MDFRRRRGSLLSIPAIVFAFVLAACGAASPAPTASPTTAPAATAVAAAFPVTVTDFQGMQVVIPKRPERIVSIGPSNTEFLFALGAGDRVIGVDDYSDAPEAAKAKEKVGGVKPNVEKIVALRTDLVVSLKITDGSLERIAGQGIPVLLLNAQGVDDVARTAVVLGTAIGADGQKLARQMDEGLGAVRAKSAAIAKKRVFHEVDATDPTKIWTAGPGSFIHGLIGIAGGLNIAASTQSQFPQLSVEEIIKADPEIIVLGDAAYGVTVEQVIARPGWSVVTAVKTKRILGVDPNLMHRAGPRIVEAAEAYFKIVSETR